MKKIILLTLLITSHADSGLYSDQEVAHFLSHNNKSNTLVGDVLTSKTPAEVVKTWMLSEQDELNKEYQIYALLNHLATMPPNDHLSPLLKQLTAYQSQAVRVHDEAHHPSQASEAIFNISTRAFGVQNIWQMKTTQQQATDILTYDKQPIAAIEHLLNQTEFNRNTTLLGIKNALQNVSTETTERFKLALHQSPELSGTILPVVTDLATLSTDENFTAWAIAHVDKTQAERIYRHIAQQFPQQSAINMLTMNIKSKANPSFVASLLSPFSQHPDVNQFLLDQLTNKSATRGAAYALSKSTDPLVWKKMENVYKNSSDPEIKNSIRFSFKSNNNEAAQLIFQRLTQNKGAQS